MFEAFKSFLSDLSSGDKHPDAFDENDHRLAAAALLIHSAVIDGKIADVERDRLHFLLKQRFALDDAATATLVEKATVVEHDSVDLYHFTRILCRSLDEAGRVSMVEMMWEVAYADGTVTEFEDNLIWRTADLLGVSSHERIALRQRVAAEMKPTGA